MVIRQETERDYAAVYALITEAFSTAAHRDGNEQDLVAALRKSAAFIPELSLVAEINGKIVGHILFTRVLVGEDTALALAPLSVLPDVQRQGIGMALIRAGHKRAEALGYDYALVLGSPSYYPKMGYVPAEQLGVEVPPGMPAEHYMAIKLREDAKPIRGAVTYAKEFGI